MHHGFSADQRQEFFQQAWLREISTTEAARIRKPDAEYPVLLTVGRK
jgi:hypothetical protein